MDCIIRVTENNERVIDWTKYEETPMLTLRDMPSLNWFPCFSTLVELQLVNLPALKLLPAEFTTLRALQKLTIVNTGLKRLPSGVGDMTHITYFKMYRNRNFPQFVHIFEKQSNTISMFLRTIKTHFGSREAAYLLLWARDLLWKHMPRDIMKLIVAECIEHVDLCLTWLYGLKMQTALLENVNDATL